MADYLSLPAIKEFIIQYEQSPTTENLKAMVTGLLTYGFDPEDDWFMKWQEDDEKGHSNCFIMRIVDGKKILHTMIKIVLDPSGVFDVAWDQCIPQLATAPLPDERCWAILIRGMKVRLYEYHRTQDPESRLIPCDFTINDKLKHTVHIRNNVAEVNNILVGIAERYPQPLDDLELEALSLKDSDLSLTPVPKPAGSDVPEVMVTAENRESTSENSSTQANEATVGTGTGPITEASPLINLDSVTEVKPATQPEAIPKVKAAAKVKSGVKDKTSSKDNAATKKKTATEAKSTPKPKTTQAKPASSTTATARLKIISIPCLPETDTSEAISN